MNNGQLDIQNDRYLYLTNPKADLLNALTATLKQVLDAHKFRDDMIDKTVAMLDVAICKVAESIVDEEEEKPCKS